MKVKGAANNRSCETVTDPAFDVAILDLQLPEADGLTLAEKSASAATDHSAAAAFFHMAAW
jgi:CheY-like chemotaxis protein